MLNLSGDANKDWHKLQIKEKALADLMDKGSLTEKEARLALRAHPGEDHMVALRWALKIKSDEEKQKREEEVK